jgi:geranylgeranyl pyrophosphate synthase
LNLESIQSPVRDELAAVEMRVHELLVPEVLDGRLARTLAASMSGERLHSSLFLLTAHAVGGIAESGISMAAGFELFHLAIRVHDAVIDQIPVEGWPRERMLIDGDHIFSKGLTLLTRGPEGSSEIAGEMIERMALGELEYVCEGLDSSVERHIGMLRDKYGSLFGASCELAALASGMDQKSMAYLREYGSNLGTAIKIGDEILNLADIVRRGRPALPVLCASDNTEQIRHLLKLRDADGLIALCSSNGGFRGAKGKTLELSEKALAVLSASGVDSGPMRDLCYWVSKRVNG